MWGLHHRVFFAALCLALLIGPPRAHGRKTGANAGYSGGPRGVGANCTECHTFRQGAGQVELVGSPRRYRPGVIYDISVRVVDAARVGAAFEISAEGRFNHQGAWSIADLSNTQLTEEGLDPNYVTHTRDGVEHTIDHWDDAGGEGEYHVRWIAPASDRGPISLYLAALAINDNEFVSGDHFYAEYAPMRFARPGDMDGDADVDLPDFAILQSCRGADGVTVGHECEIADRDGDSVVSHGDAVALLERYSGPFALDPAAFVLADPVRGGRLYDTWWVVNGAAVPAGDHPLYPQVGVQSGNVTFRCKECHGWDYKGVNGQYGAGPHFSGVRGVFDISMSPQEIFELLKADSSQTPAGHDMDAFGMTDADLWDVVKFVLEGVVDTDELVNGAGSFVGDLNLGEVTYTFGCASCHGFDGREINFGTVAEPLYIGSIANENPWEFLHKVRHGQPGTPMLGTEALRYAPENAAQIGAYAQTLPD